jgi:hypothetical protein
MSSVAQPSASRISLIYPNMSHGPHQWKISIKYIHDVDGFVTEY